MKVNISVESLKDAILARILGSVASYYSGSESKVPYYLIRDEFKVTYRDFEDVVNRMPNNYEKGQLVGVIESINRHAYGYSDRHDGMYVEVPDSLMNNQDIYESYALKAALEDVEKNDTDGEITGVTPDGESDPIGGTQSSVIKALIDDMVSRVSSDVAKTTNTIIEIEKTKNDQNKAALGVDDSAGEDELNLDDELGEGEDQEGDTPEDLTNEEGSDEFADLTEGDTDLEKDSGDLDSMLDEESKDDVKETEEKKDKSEDLDEGDSKDKEKKEDNPFNALESVYDSSLKNIKGLEAGTEGLLGTTGKIFATVSLLGLGYAIGAMKRLSKITDTEADVKVLENKVKSLFKGLTGEVPKRHRLTNEEVKEAEQSLLTNFNRLQDSMFTSVKNVSFVDEIIKDILNVEEVEKDNVDVLKVERPRKIIAGETIPLLRFTITDPNFIKLSDSFAVTVSESIFYYLLEGFKEVANKSESVKPFVKELASFTFPYDIMYDEVSRNTFDISIILSTKID